MSDEHSADDGAPIPPHIEPVPPASADGAPPVDIEPVPPAGDGTASLVNIEPVPPASDNVGQRAHIEPVPPAHGDGPVASIQPVPPAQVSAEPQNPQVRSGAAVPIVGAAGARTKPRRYNYVKQPKLEVSVFLILLTLVGAVLLAASVMALLPKNLSSLGGYPTDWLSNKEPTNLLLAGRQALANGSQTVSFSEQEVNAYLNYRFSGKQDGPMGGVAKANGVYVDLREGEVEIYVVRSLPVLGCTTMSKVVGRSAADEAGQQIWEAKGGSVGRIPIFGRLNVQPVLNVFLRMSQVASKELEVVNAMLEIKLEDHQITLASPLN